MVDIPLISKAEAGGSLSPRSRSSRTARATKRNPISNKQTKRFVKGNINTEESELSLYTILLVVNL